MEFPKKLKFGRKIFKIKLIPGLADKYDSLDGRISWDESEIQINSNLTKESQIETMTHEMFHAIMHRVGRLQSSENPEQIAETMTIGLLDMLHENPWLIDMWKEII